MKTFIVYWYDNSLVERDPESRGEFELDAPNLETAYETANAEWPELTIMNIKQAS